jgi:hypothetical protein
MFSLQKWMGSGTILSYATLNDAQDWQKNQGFGFRFMGLELSLRQSKKIRV